jgi:Flp pilus assembly protein TadG
MLSGDRLRGDAGSSLMLMPAAVMVVLVLGAIAVDLSVVHLAHRDLLSVADSAANDAVTAGLDPDALRATGEYHLDIGRATQAVQRTLAVHQLTGRATIIAVTTGPAPGQVTVELSMTVDYVFAKAIPGANDGTTVRAHATATAAQR